MIRFRNILCVSFFVALVLVVSGIGPDSFVRPRAVSGNYVIPEWHAANKPVSCTSGVIESSVLLESKVAAPVCDDLLGHLERVEAITNQITFLADWSDVSDQNDERVTSAMRRVGVLNNEREALYNHMDHCVAVGRITPLEHEIISSLWIVPTWRNLAAASTRLDGAIIGRVVLNN